MPKKKEEVIENWMEETSEGDIKDAVLKKPIECCGKKFNSENEFYWHKRKCH